MKLVHWQNAALLAVLMIQIDQQIFGMLSGSQGLAISGPLLIGLLILGWYSMVKGDPLDVDSRFPVADASMEGGGEDPWRLQEEVMRRSGQYLAPQPELTKGSLLYLALVVEEASEGWRHAAEMLPFSGGNDRIKQSLYEWGRIMDQWSKQMRGMLEPYADDHVFHVLTLEEAAKLLDDASDIIVVGAGFSVATGLPGREGYYEVCESNLSKANPETGLIDRDASGKWIKGYRYREPDLGKVIANHYGL